MGPLMSWEQEIAEIFANKEKADIADFREKLREAGRSAPCRNFFAVPPRCFLGHELDCLICPDYQPHETPGTWDKGYALFECGRVVHLVRSVVSDGFYRSAKALYGRWLSEEDDAVEIYPLDSFDELPTDLATKTVCRLCQKYGNRA